MCTGLLASSAFAPPFVLTGALGCNSTSLHSCGSYTRKGSHGVADPVVVPRTRCLDCRRTFGALPQDILPICRAALPLLKKVAGLFERGVALRQICRLTGLSRGVLARIQERIITFGTALVSLARGDGHIDGAHDPVSLVGILRLSALRPWVETTYALSRAVYPRRWPTGPPDHRRTRFVHD